MSTSASHAVPPSAAPSLEALAIAKIADRISKQPALLSGVAKSNPNIVSMASNPASWSLVSKAGLFTKTLNFKLAGSSGVTASASFRDGAWIAIVIDDPILTQKQAAAQQAAAQQAAGQQPPNKGLGSTQSGASGSGVAGSGVAGSGVAGSGVAGVPSPTLPASVIAMLTALSAAEMAEAIRVLSSILASGGSATLPGTPAHANVPAPGTTGGATAAVPRAVVPSTAHIVGLAQQFGHQADHARMGDFLFDLYSPAPGEMCAVVAHRDLDPTLPSLPAKCHLPLKLLGLGAGWMKPTSHPSLQGQPTGMPYLLTSLDPSATPEIIADTLEAFGMTQSSGVLDLIS